jgi:ATP-dependent exoDNAse (exonuclease V) alpha subunit
MTQKEALDILKMGKNVFITGPAGSGKTHLLNEYISFLKERFIDVGITASTGIAATHMGGVTIHSWSGIGIKPELGDDEIAGLLDKKYLADRFKTVKVLIIDEVSMLHHFRLDMVERVCRAFKGNDIPFGGIQVVLCGDFFQLPPIARFGEPAAQFAFAADSWREAGFIICYLTEQHRQKDHEMLSILNEIRENRVSDKTIEVLKSKTKKTPSKDEIEPTKLYSHNIDIDRINEGELDKIDEGATVHKMTAKGNPHLIESLKKSCLAPEVLRLKFGARVMCVKNDFEAGFVNGTLGIVTACPTGGNPIIKTADGRRITIERAQWSINDDGGRSLAEINQYPLRLAWAITIHKSQGMSLDAVEVDLSKSFEPGMGYVALSRVKTLDGLVVIGLNDTALQIRGDVLEHDMNLRQESERAQVMLETMGTGDVKKEQEAFIARVAGEKPAKKEKKKPTLAETREFVDAGKSLEEIATLRKVTKDTILDHVEKLIETGESIDISKWKYDISKTHWPKIEKAILEVHESEGKVLLSPVKNKLGAQISFLEIRIARAVLGLISKKE